MIPRGTIDAMSIVTRACEGLHCAKSTAPLEMHALRESESSGTSSSSAMLEMLSTTSSNSVLPDSSSTSQSSQMKLVASSHT